MPVVNIKFILHS